jgi:hypothetical protein
VNAIQVSSIHENQSRRRQSSKRVNDEVREFFTRKA